MAKINTEALVSSAQSRAPISEGVTLVAAYGNRKPKPFEMLLAELKKRCNATTIYSQWIRLYNDEQVHATIVGLEGDRCGDRVVQKNMQDRLGGIEHAPPMRLEGLVGFLRSPICGFDLAIGGFQKGDVNPFDPERKPYDRSFDIRSDGLIVAMGWPLTGALFMPHLINLRKNLEKFNVVHKYHIRTQDLDNDLFFVLGEIDVDKWKNASDNEREDVQKAIDDLVAQCRLDLSKQRYVFCLSASDLNVVKYRYRSLAEIIYAEQASRIRPATLLNLYPDCA